MQKVLLAALGLMGLSACASHNLCATYTGILPSSEGSGLATELTLNPDGTFEMESVYVDKNTTVFADSGTYSISYDNVLTLNSETMAMSYFQLEEGQVRKLDNHMQPVIGSMSDAYILTESNTCNLPEKKK